MSETKTESIERFGGLADAYERYRPTYPAAAIAAILAGLPVPAAVVDVGAGTGISTRALAAAGARAIAIEPNAGMREKAAALGLDVRDGNADATGLPSASADVVSAFQAFHWFARPACVAEFKRVLRPNGRLAIVWNERDRSDAFTAEFRAAEERHCDPAKLAGADFADDRLAPLIEGGGFGPLRLTVFDNRQRMDEDGVIGRIRASSYTPREGPALDALLSDVLESYRRYRDPEGFVDMVYRTEVYLAENA